MDTVNMLNTMRFYCQPILPLVYDESMSYYETLCKVVGQLNTTGETVNKLNEGLTNEIADRQAADAALDERLKTIESTNAKIHFLAFAGTPPHDAKPVGAMPTRSELRQWVTDGDMIVTLMQTTDEGRNIVYAASCAYNAPNWENASFDGFNIIVPISTAYDSEGDCAVRQKIAKITIPPASAASLDEKWGLQFIEINTPHTSAEGMVNFTATVVGETVTASITPAEFIKLFDAASATAKLCVGVNARLNYNALELSSSVATVYDNSSTKREVRITFVQDPRAGRRDYVPSEIFDLVNIVGDKDTNTWKVETFGTELFDFHRYEGFQFTRKTGNVIEAAEDCDPASVAQYYNDLHGKEYQNLPIHLIDEVDNADYWNGTFDSYSDGHITFTFTTANYATIGEKMVVRVIELSATRTGAAWVGDEKWVYAAKEFDIPYRPTSYLLDVWQANDTPTISNGRVSYEANSSLDFDNILELVDGAQDIIATLHKGTSETSPEWSGLVYSLKNVENGVGSIVFAATAPIQLHNGIPSMNGAVVFSKDAAGAKKVTIRFSGALPVPSADGSDDGKVPTVVGNGWGLETPSGGSTPGGSSHAVLYVSQTLTDEQKKQARDNVDAAGRFVVNGTINESGTVTLDKTYAQILEAINAGKSPIAVYIDRIYLQLTYKDDIGILFSSILTDNGIHRFCGLFVYSNDSKEIFFDRFLILKPDGKMPQTPMVAAPTEDMEIATKKYVDDAVSSPNIKDMSSAWNPTVLSSKSGKVVINDKHLFYYPGLDAVYFSLALIGFENADIASTVGIDMNASALINGISLLPKIDVGFTAQFFVQSVTGLCPNSMVSPAYLNVNGLLGIVLTEDAPGALTSYATINGWYLANSPSSN